MMYLLSFQSISLADDIPIIFVVISLAYETLNGEVWHRSKDITLAQGRAVISRTGVDFQSFKASCEDNYHDNASLEVCYMDKIMFSTLINLEPGKYRTYTLKFLEGLNELPLAWKRYLSNSG